MTLHEDHCDRPCGSELRAQVLSSELIDRKEDREEDPVIDMRKPQVRHTPHRKADEGNEAERPQDQKTS